MMITECIAIVLIVIAVASSFAKKRKGHYAASSLPLMIIPVLHIVASLAAGDYPSVIVAVNFAAFGVSLACFVICSKLFKTPKVRTFYVALCSLFSLFLAVECSFHLIPLIR